MNGFLSLAGSALVGGIARERTLLVFGFDGTLAPLVNEPERAEVRDETRALLRVAALLYPCAVVSGRTRADLLKRVADVPLVAVIGCHGSEPGFGPLDPALLRRVAEWRPKLERSLVHSPGIELEDRRLAIALHYRKARSQELARRDALAAATRLQGAVVFEGRAVVNVLPRGAPAMADAVAALRARLGLAQAVSIGADSRDEHACAGSIGVSVGDGRTRDPAVAYCLANQAQIDDFLRALVVARVRLDGRPDRVEGVVRALSADRLSTRTG